MKTIVILVNIISILLFTLLSSRQQTCSAVNTRTRSNSLIPRYSSCGAGQYFDSTTSMCYDCPAGTSTNSLSNLTGGLENSCFPCIKNTWNDAAGSATCKNHCPQYFSPVTSSISESSCGDGSDDKMQDADFSKVLLQRDGWKDVLDSTGASGNTYTFIPPADNTGMMCTVGEYIYFFTKSLPFDKNLQMPPLSNSPTKTSFFVKMRQYDLTQVDAIQISDIFPPNNVNRTSLNPVSLICDDESSSSSSSTPPLAEFFAYAILVDETFPTESSLFVKINLKPTTSPYPLSSSSSSLDNNMKIVESFVVPGLTNIVTHSSTLKINGANGKKELYFRALFNTSALQTQYLQNQPATAETTRTVSPWSNVPTSLPCYNNNNNNWLIEEDFIVIDISAASSNSFSKIDFLFVQRFYCDGLLTNSSFTENFRNQILQHTKKKTTSSQEEVDEDLLYLGSIGQCPKITIFNTTTTGIFEKASQPEIVFPIPDSSVDYNIVYERFPSDFDIVSIQFARYFSKANTIIFATTKRGVIFQFRRTLDPVLNEQQGKFFHVVTRSGRFYWVHPFLRNSPKCFLYAGNYHCDEYVSHQNGGGVSVVTVEHRDGDSQTNSVITDVDIFLYTVINKFTPLTPGNMYHPLRVVKLHFREREEPSSSLKFLQEFTFPHDSELSNGLMFSSTISPTSTTKNRNSLLTLSAYPTPEERSRNYLYVTTFSISTGIYKIWAGNSSLTETPSMTRTNTKSYSTPVTKQTKRSKSFSFSENSPSESFSKKRTESETNSNEKTTISETSSETIYSTITRRKARSYTVGGGGDKYRTKTIPVDSNRIRTTTTTISISKKTKTISDQETLSQEQNSTTLELSPSNSQSRNTFSLSAELTSTITLKPKVPFVLPVPVSQQLTDSAVGISTATGAANAVVVNQVQRSLSLLTIVRCGTDAALPLNLAASITGASIGDDWMQFHRGAVIMNVVIAIGLVLLYFLVTCVVMCVKKLSLKEAIYLTRFPSYLVSPFALLGAPTATSATVLFWYSTTADVMLVVFFGLLLVAGPGVCLIAFYQFQKQFNFKTVPVVVQSKKELFGRETSSPLGESFLGHPSSPVDYDYGDDAGLTNQKSRYSKKDDSWRFKLISAWYYYVRSKESYEFGRQKNHPVIRQFQPLYDPHDKMWWLIADWIVTMICAIMAGISTHISFANTSSPSTCIAAAIVSLVALSVHFLLFVVFWPLLSRALSVVQVFLCAISVINAILSTLILVGSNVSNSMESFETTQSAVAVIAGIVLFFDGLVMMVEFISNLESDARNKDEETAPVLITTSSSGFATKKTKLATLKAAAILAALEARHRKKQLDTLEHHSNSNNNKSLSLNLSLSSSSRSRSGSREPTTEKKKNDPSSSPSSSPETEMNKLKHLRHAAQLAMAAARFSGNNNNKNKNKIQQQQQKALEASLSLLSSSNNSSGGFSPGELKRFGSGFAFLDDEELQEMADLRKIESDVLALRNNTFGNNTNNNNGVAMPPPSTAMGESDFWSAVSAGVSPDVHRHNDFNDISMEESSRSDDDLSANANKSLIFSQHMQPPVRASSQVSRHRQYLEKLLGGETRKNNQNINNQTTDEEEMPSGVYEALQALKKREQQQIQENILLQHKNSDFVDEKNSSSSSSPTPNRIKVPQQNKADAFVSSSTFGNFVDALGASASSPMLVVPTLNSDNNNSPSTSPRNRRRSSVKFVEEEESQAFVRGRGPLDVDKNNYNEKQHSRYEDL